MNKNTSRLVFLATVIVVFSGIIVFKNIVQSFMSQNIPQPFKQIKKPDVNEIAVQDDKNETKVYKNKNIWTLQKDGVEYPADIERIETIINGFINLQKGETVSNNKDKHSSLGIGTKKITLKSNNQQFAIYIGNVAAMSKNYIRINNDNDVFISSGFNDMFTFNDYRDLHVHLINSEEKINEIEIAFDNTILTLVKKNNQWYSKDAKLKKERVDFFLNDLKILKAANILNKDSSSSGTNLSIKVKENNQEKTAEFSLPAEQAGQKDNTAYILKTSTSDRVFKIDGVYVSSLKKQEKDFAE
ncbi:DUF4340 domain-containing protein [Candidatus Roizmanbacteria bacterium]|nr:DUF4340 domain-containing protein [Candidatus Roizmanbacteria bacterium]